MNLQDFSRLASSHVRRYNRNEPDALAGALTPFAEADVAADLINSIMSDEIWLDSVARSSYLHPNGFGKFVLLSSADYQVRLHLWKEPDSRVAKFENVHNHRWDFSSILLLGGYRYQEFTESPDGENFHAYTYESQRGTSTYSLQPLGRRTLLCSFDAYLRAGTSYTLRSNVLHRVVGDSRHVTASLILQGERQPTKVRVFAKDAYAAGPALPLIRYSRDVVTADLHCLMSALQKVSR